MSTTLPAQARLDVAPFILNYGLFGLLQTVHGAMRRAAPDRNETPDLEELALVSGVAFKNYMPEFEADDPQAFQPDPLGKYVCNWGVFESLGYYYGWDLKEFLTLDILDFWKLLQFEIASGRPVVTLDADNALQPMLVVGYAFEKVEITGEDGKIRLGVRKCMDVLRAGRAEVETLDKSDVLDFQPDEPALRNWMLIARPSTRPEYAPSPQLLRMRVLRWAVSHAENRRELSHEFSRHYASGRQAFEAFLARLDMLIAKGQTLDSVDAEWAAFARTHVAELATARAAAARQLPIWAQEFAADAEFFGEPEPAFDVAMRTSADAFARVAQRLQAWDGEDIGNLRVAYREAYEAEGAATSALSDALQHLPSGI